MSQNDITTTEQDEEPSRDPREEVNHPPNADMESYDGDVNIASEASDDLKPKELNATDEAGPLEQLTGDSSGEREINQAVIHEWLADDIYDSKAAFVREYLQNAETACIRACKTLIRHHDDYGEEALWHDILIDAETGETVARGMDLDEFVNCDANDYDANDLRSIRVPKKLGTVVQMARDIGYNPKIDIQLDRDTRRLIWRDNGIGMTVKEVDGAFNVTGDSGVLEEGDTGGFKGMGSLTFKTVAGEQGDMIVETRTRRPNVHPVNYDGIKFTAYLGGWDEIPNHDIDDDFKGTRFTIPIQDSFPIENLHQWVKEYTTGLRVPVLYREFRGGETSVKEEYGDVDIIEKFDNPPVVIDRPGEFTVVAGPDMQVGSSRVDDTWLVSMPIERNSRHTAGSMWSAAIQLHDEQERIVAGPHRGYYHDDGTVYETQKCNNEVASLHEDDVPMPSPTADRDRLEKGVPNNRFMKFLNKRLKGEELKQVSHVAEDLDCDDPHDAIRGRPNDWSLFYRMIDYHGSYNTTSTQSALKNFFDNHAPFPDYDESQMHDIYELFQTINVAPRGKRKARKKRRRSNELFGDFLAKKDPEEVFMAASTSKVFEERCTVVWNTWDSSQVVVIDGASEYPEYEERYGWRKLKDVPRTQSDDHEFDVPDSIHDANTVTKTDLDDSEDGGDSDGAQENAFENRVLKFRYKSRQGGIDRKKTIAHVKDALSSGKTIGPRRYVVLYPRGGKNISDNKWMQKYAAIASCTKGELDALEEFDRVFTHDEFIEFARDTVIATEKGGFTVRELTERLNGDSDECLVLLNARGKKDKRLLKNDEFEARCRARFRDYMHDYKSGGYGSDSLSDKEPFFGVADDKTLERAGVAFRDLEHNRGNRIIGMYFGYNGPGVKTRLSWDSPRRNRDTMEKRARHPQWDDDSQMLTWIDSSKDYKAAMAEVFRDKDIDPSMMDSEVLKDMLSTMDVERFESPDDGRYEWSPAAWEAFHEVM